jgi:hypothetical protein
MAFLENDDQLRQVKIASRSPDPQVERDALIVDAIPEPKNSLSVRSGVERNDSGLVFGKSAAIKTHDCVQCHTMLIITVNLVNHLNNPALRRPQSS